MNGNEGVLILSLLLGLIVGQMLGPLLYIALVKLSDWWRWKRG